MYDPPGSGFSGYPLRHLPKGPRPCPHIRAHVHLPAATDLQLLLHGCSLQQANNDARIMQCLTPRNVTECNEICQGARRRRRSGRVIDLRPRAGPPCKRASRLRPILAPQARQMAADGLGRSLDGSDAQGVSARLQPAVGVNNASCNRRVKVSESAKASLYTYF